MTKLNFQVRPDGQGPFNCLLEITQEYVDVTTIGGVHVPNLAWEFVDEAGHYHAFGKDESLPTVDRHVVRHECSDPECDGVDEIRTVCKLCAEPITPAYNVDSGQKAIPGRSFWEASILGVHLAINTKVSLSFSEPATGHVQYFGIGQVVGNGLETHDGGATYITRVFGQGPLARKGK
jgi:hypothetical protein